MESMKCGLAPDGWSCKRESGHDGPCAAELSLSPIASLRILLNQPMAGDYYDLRIGKAFRNALLAELDRCTPPQAAQGDWSDSSIRAWWQLLGGRFFGPHEETAAIPESLFLPTMRRLLQPTPPRAEVSEEMVEAGARGICKWLGKDPDKVLHGKREGSTALAWQEYQNIAFAALTAALAGGGK